MRTLTRAQFGHSLVAGEAHGWFAQRRGVGGIIIGGLTSWQVLYRFQNLMQVKRLRWLCDRHSEDRWTEEEGEQRQVRRCWIKCEILKKNIGTGARKAVCCEAQLVNCIPYPTMYYLACEYKQQKGEIPFMRPIIEAHNSKLCQIYP